MRKWRRLCGLRFRWWMCGRKSEPLRELVEGKGNRKNGRGRLGGEGWRASGKGWWRWAWGAVGKCDGPEEGATRRSL